MKLIAFILILVCCLWTSLEAGEIYKWIDESGVKYFSNEPPPRGVKRVNATNEIPYDKASDQKRSREEIEALKKDLQQQEASTSQAALTESSNSRDSDAGVIVDPSGRPREGERRQDQRKESKQEKPELLANDITDEDEEANVGDPDEKKNIDDPDEQENIDDPDEQKNIGDPDEKKDFEQE
jgi:FtsZ-interacting cell division protein ZipA